MIVCAITVLKMIAANEGSTPYNNDGRLEIIGINEDNLNIVLRFESYEGIEFLSIEDAKNHYIRYAKNKCFNFCMGRITKSRTTVIKIGQEILF